MECIFCKIASKEIVSEVVSESDNLIAFLDANPIVEGHVLIIPKKHFVNFLDLPSSLGEELSDFIKQIAKEKLKHGAEGFNLLMRNGSSAGQEVFHTHLHLIPRKKDDGVNCLPV